MSMFDYIDNIKLDALQRYENGQSFDTIRTRLHRKIDEIIDKLEADKQFKIAPRKKMYEDDF